MPAVTVPTFDAAGQARSSATLPGVEGARAGTVASGQRGTPASCAVRPGGVSTEISVNAAELEPRVTCVPNEVKEPARVLLEPALKPGRVSPSQFSSIVNREVPVLAGAPDQGV